jgi:hypothetical protein
MHQHRLRLLVVGGSLAVGLSLGTGAAALSGDSGADARPPSPVRAMASSHPALLQLDGPRSTTTSTAPSTTTTTAAPTTTTTTAPADPVEAALQRWFGDVYAKASDVVWCESRRDPNAVSPGGGNHGLFQINNVHRSSFEQVTGVAFEDGVYDPDLNSRFARWLYDQQGWEPWACG